MQNATFGLVLTACSIINVSQCYALYTLGLFYIETRQWLKPLNPLGKFAVVKVSPWLQKCQNKVSHGSWKLTA